MLWFFFIQTTPKNSLEKPLVTLTKQQREALEKRKLIWTKKRDNTKIVLAPTAVVTPTTSNSWETVQFSQDDGGVVASKFLRLMGAKDVQPAAAVDGAVVDQEAVEKRSQMFSTMERQFETALKTTHKKKGQGLGSGGPVATKKYF